MTTYDTLERRRRIAFLPVTVLSVLAVVAVFLAPCSVATQPEAWTGRPLIAQRASVGELPERREGIQSAERRLATPIEDANPSQPEILWLVIVSVLSCSLLVNLLLIRWCTRLQRSCHEFACESQIFDQRVIERIRR